MKKKIGILSDLHLEVSNMKLEELSCDVLILAGDISQDFSLLPNFFNYNIPENMPVIYVPGNHEYEGKCMSDVINKLREITKEFPNIHVLQNESIDIEGIHFIGSTLWSNFEGGGYNWKEEVMTWCKTNVVDFNAIYKKNPDIETEFIKSYNFIKYELMVNETENTKFVVTHFAPHIESLSKHFKDVLTSAYWVNNLPELMGFCDYWVHGHTHSSFNYNVEGTNVICNPRGMSKLYDLSQNISFDKCFQLEVEVKDKLHKPKM